MRHFAADDVWVCGKFGVSVRCDHDIVGHAGVVISGCVSDDVLWRVL